MRIHRLAVLIIAALVAFVLAGCGGKAAPLLSPQPPSAEVVAVQHIAGRVADGVTIGGRLIDDTGRLIDGLPLAVETKDKYDCAVLRVTGSDSPSQTVARFCGPLPRLAEAPLTKARNQLQALTTCPSLRATTAVVLGAVDPFIIQLALSENPSLVFASSAIRTAFAYARSFLEGGAECSVSQ